MTLRNVELAQEPKDLRPDLVLLWEMVEAATNDSFFTRPFPPSKQQYCEELINI